MSNEVYNHLVSRLSSFLGNSTDLPSGNGTRYKNQSRMVVTVYHSNISQGNAAEIAVKQESLASSYGYTQHQSRNHVEAIQAFTNHPVKPDPKYNWPRVGIRTIDEADRVLTYMAGLNV